jgi:hypothetical protein
MQCLFRNILLKWASTGYSISTDKELPDPKRLFQNFIRAHFRPRQKLKLSGSEELPQYGLTRHTRKPRQRVISLISEQ